jgi:hypothetical protein
VEDPLGDKETNTRRDGQVKLGTDLLSKILNTVRKGQIEVFGHIKRHSSILKGILEGKI